MPDPLDTTSPAHPWERLRELTDARDAGAVDAFLNSLPPWEQSRAVSRLSDDDRTKLLNLLPPARATDLMEVVNITQAVEMLQGLEPQKAADIVDGMASDQQADVINEMSQAKAEAILTKMSPEGAADARNLAKYGAHTAGGMMNVEYLAFPRQLRVVDLLDAFRAYAAMFSDYPVQYTYIIDGEGRLVGVLPMRSLLFSDPQTRVSALMIAKPVNLAAAMPVDEVISLFEQNKYLALPVTDERGRLVGVVRRAAVEEASTAKANQTLLKISGIIGGEEFRSMPLYSRAGRRLAWLTLNIGLNLIAASIVALYIDVLEKAVVLAIFMPIISDMSGCSGNQAVGVSIRELTLGLIRPRELWRVLFKESAIGLVNGVVLGVLLGLVAFAWQQNAYLGLVVGGALMINTFVSVLVGGTLPLIGKTLRLDPALVSGPLLTTVTDMCGFFFVLSFAQAVLPHLEEPEESPAVMLLRMLGMA